MNRREFLHRFTGDEQDQPIPPASPESIPGKGTLPKLQSVPTLEPYTGPWNRRTILHLLRRTVLAPSYEELIAAERMTMKELVETLIAPSHSLPEPYGYVADWMAHGTMYYDSNRLDRSFAFREELRRWWCEQMITGGLNIRERMTFFWHNHFACDASVNPDQRLIYLQNQLFRQHAVGNFKDLVRAVTIDKAMLWFLNGRQNKKLEVNENYARELQELFTLGVVDNNGQPNYTQQDVAQVALALTGWYFEEGSVPPPVACREYWHDKRDKTIYGQHFAGREDGGEELDQLLDVIFARPETARYIVRKLYRFIFHTDVPLTPFFPIAEEIENAIIIPLAEEFRDSNWSIAAVLRRLFMSQHFYDAGLMGAYIKSPVDLFVGTARALLTGPLEGERWEHLLQAIHMMSTQTGQWLFVPPGVQGWQFHRTWISGTTLPLRRAHTDKLIDGWTYQYYYALQVELPTGEKTGFAQIPVLPYARQFPWFEREPVLLVRGIAEHLLPYPPSPQLQQQLLDALMQGAPEYEWLEFPDQLKEARLKGMLKFLMRSANYQLL